MYIVPYIKKLWMFRKKMCLDKKKGAYYFLVLN